MYCDVLFRLRPLYSCHSPRYTTQHRGYPGGSPTAVQAWQPCLLWKPSPSRPILL